MIARNQPGEITTPALPAEPTASPRVRVFLWVFSVVLIVTAGSAFIMKLVEFIHTATTRGSDALASFLIPVLNYLFVAAGFFCLFLWAYFTGQFRDVERCGRRMLELQDEIDAREGAKAQKQAGKK